MRSGSSRTCRSPRSRSPARCRSCRRYVILKFDLADFFPSVHAARVHAVFRTLGYPVEVARVLTGLCTTRLPNLNQLGGVGLPVREYGPADRHLPQGAPTSPAL